VCFCKNVKTCKQLAAVESGKTEFVTIDELDRDLQATIDKYEA